MSRHTLSKDEIVTIHTLIAKGVANTRIANTIGVPESTVRYHRKKGPPTGRPDKRRKRMLIEELDLEQVVQRLYDLEKERVGEDRAVNCLSLYEHLRDGHGYSGSEKSVRKYVRLHFPRPRLRTYRRIETPPGAQMQTDWVEYRDLEVGHADGPQTVYAFIMTLSHSRKQAVVWSLGCDQVAWHHCHNEAFRRLGGVAAVNRIDNCKTGISQGAGAWGTVQPAYRRYAQTMGFHVDACAPRQPQQKGKVERGGGMLRRLGIERRQWSGLEELQAYTDAQIERAEGQRLCPVTGETVTEAWMRERQLLRSLPALLPEPFDAFRTAVVSKDCLVHFEGRQYAVPFCEAGTVVEIRGCAGRVQVVDAKTGEVIKQYPRHTKARLLIDPDCYEGESTPLVLAPTPLGAMAKRLAELGAEQVERRSTEWYALLAGVAR